MAAAVMLAMTPVLPAQAQSSGSLSDFRLPPGNTTQPEPTTGPVDELPVPDGNAATPSPQRAPAAPPSATRVAPPPIVIPPPPTGAVDAAPPPEAQARRATPAPETTAGSEPVSVTPDQTPEIVPPMPPPTPAAAQPVTPAQAAPATDQIEARTPAWIWWASGVVALSLALAGVAFGLHRRRLAVASTVLEADVLVEVEQPKESPLPLRPASVPAGQPEPAPTPSSTSPRRIDLVFEPQSLTMALINARLTYRLSLTNQADVAIGPVSISGDIISAHASIKRSDQLIFDDEMTKPQHQIASLGAGETVTLAGELQIPIAAILPIRSGDASLFVPLARLHMTMRSENQPPLVSTRVFVVGERPEQPWERLKPIRIDLGQRTFSHISQREVEASA